MQLSTWSNLTKTFKEYWIHKEDNVLKNIQFIVLSRSALKLSHRDLHIIHPLLPWWVIWRLRQIFLEASRQPRRSTYTISDYPNFYYLRITWGARKEDSMQRLSRHHLRSILSIMEQRDSLQFSKIIISIVSLDVTWGDKNRTRRDVSNDWIGLLPTFHSQHLPEVRRQRGLVCDHVRTQSALLLEHEYCLLDHQKVSWMRKRSKLGRTGARSLSRPDDRSDPLLRAIYLFLAYYLSFR